MGLCSVLVLIRITDSRSEGTSKNHIFTNASHVLDHNNLYLNDTLK